MRKIVSVVLTGFILMACGGGGSKSATSSTGSNGASRASTASSNANVQPTGSQLDPCTLVTQSEAEAALGTTLGPADTSFHGGPFKWCTYAPAGVDLPSVRIAVGGGFTQQQFEDFVDSEVRGGLTKEPIRNLADAAYDYGSVALLKGDVVVGITAVTADGGDADAAQRKLAQIVNDRL